MIPIKNGIQLSAVIVRFEGDTTALPTLLVASCYPSSFNDATILKRVLRKGFAGIIVYSRGKNNSTGSFEPFEHEAEDMYEVINWISHQWWCNGKVGMFGGSYLGFTQWAALKKPHPALKTIVPQVAAAPGFDFPSQNGVFMSYMLRWINYATNSKLNDSRSFHDTGYWNALYQSHRKSGAAFNRLDTFDEKQDIIFQRWLRHPDYDSFWKAMIPSTPEEFAAIKIPVLTITGYFDGDQLGALYYYRMHQQYGQAKDHYLLLGPWDHAGAQTRQDRTLGAYTVDSLARLSIETVVMDWFEHIFYGKPTPTILKDKVNYFVMDQGWKHAASLRATHKDTVRFFVGTQQVDRAYLLSENCNVKLGELVLSYDLENEIRYGMPASNQNENNTPGVEPGNQFVFQSPPLMHDLELAGNPVTDLFVASSKKDIDLQLSFYEVTPDGKSLYLSSFVQRASYLNDRSKRQLLTPARINHLQMGNSFFIAKLLKQGSAIRLVIKPLNAPDWQRNYGSGKDVSKETAADNAPTTLKIFTGDGQSSSIQLPVTITNN